MQAGLIPTRTTHSGLGRIPTICPHLGARVHFNAADFPLYNKTGRGRIQRQGSPKAP